MKDFKYSYKIIMICLDRGMLHVYSATTKPPPLWD